MQCVAGRVEVAVVYVSCKSEMLEKRRTKSRSSQTACLSPNTCSAGHKKHKNPKSKVLGSAKLLKKSRDRCHASLHPSHAKPYSALPYSRLLLYPHIPKVTHFLFSSYHRGVTSLDSRLNNMRFYYIHIHYYITSNQK